MSAYKIQFKLITTILLIVATPSLSTGQVDKIKRIEFSKKDHSRFNANVINKSQLLLTYRNNEKIGRLRSWSFKIYDDKLDEVNSLEYKIDQAFHTKYSSTKNNTVYHLFNGNGYKNGYKLLSVNNELNIREVNFEKKKYTYIWYFDIIKDHAICAGSLFRKPYVIFVNTETGHLREIHFNIEGYKEKELTVSRFEVFEDKDEVLFYLRAHQINEHIKLTNLPDGFYIVKMNSKGDIISQFKVHDGNSKKFMDIRSIPIGDNMYKHIGSYQVDPTMSRANAFRFSEEL